MRAWLDSVLAAGRDLPPAVEGHLLGRGMREELSHALGMGLWKSPELVAPDSAFRERYGARGQYLDGRLVCPFLSPRGDLIGFEARSWRGEKRITDYRLREAAWNPVFLGLTPDAVARLYAGGNAWIVEGLFDLAALDRVVPPEDVILATVRAKLSHRHVGFLRRILHPTALVNMVYDNDETGRKQTHGWVDDKTGKRRWGALEVLQHADLRCRDIPYRGKDPGVVWDTGGQAALHETFKFAI
jgi:hypothetical protein